MSEKLLASWHQCFVEYKVWFGCSFRCGSFTHTDSTVWCFICFRFLMHAYLVPSTCGLKERNETHCLQLTHSPFNDKPKMSSLSVHQVRTRWLWFLWRPRKAQMPWRTSCIGRATPAPVSMAIAPSETERRPWASSDQENAPFWWPQRSVKWKSSMKMVKLVLIMCILHLYGSKY